MGSGGVDGDGGGGSEMRRDALAQQSVKELKALAAKQSLSLAGCFEKSDIVDKLLHHFASSDGSAAASASASAAASAASAADGCKYLQTLREFPPVKFIDDVASEPGIEEVNAVAEGLAKLNAHAKHLVPLIDACMADSELVKTPEGQAQIAAFAAEASLTVKRHEEALVKGQKRVMAGLNWCSRHESVTPGADRPCETLKVMLARNRQLMLDGVTVEKDGHFTNTPGKPGLLALGQRLGEFASEFRGHKQ